MNRQELKKKVWQTVNHLIGKVGYASPVAHFVHMGKLSSKLVSQWKSGHVSYLEREMKGNLNEFSFIMKEFRQAAKELKLKPSYTAYMSQGKGAKKPLRFSKTGDVQVERHYATHFVKPQQKPPAQTVEADVKP